jgi:hypothetical protein
LEVSGVLIMSPNEQEVNKINLAFALLIALKVAGLIN